MNNTHKPNIDVHFQKSYFEENRSQKPYKNMKICHPSTQNDHSLIEMNIS